MSCRSRRLVCNYRFRLWLLLLHLLIARNRQ
jgi:hypothetical protein